MGTSVEGVAGVDLTKTSSTAEFKLGTIIQDLNGSFYQYVRAGGALTKGLVYSMQGSAYSLGANAFTTGSYNAENACELVVPQHANFTATNIYGWVFCGPGRFVVYAAPGSVGGKSLYSSTTAGYLWQSTSSHYSTPAWAELQFATSALGTAIAATKLWAS